MPESIGKLGEVVGILIIFDEEEAVDKNVIYLIIVK